MAGIVGIARNGQEERVQAALSEIGHRGGAGRSVRSYRGATLGQIWPPAGEPFVNRVDRHRVVLDGEIHNWTDLVAGATCPLGALEKAYRSRGPEFVEKLDGPFALAIAGGNGVFLARDLLGKSPLYYGQCAGGLCFASEIKALVRWANEIAEFPPGHYYESGQGLVQYARLKGRPTIAEVPPHEVAKQLRARLVKSVQKRLGNGDTGAWLSGGLDSATMTALARQQVPTLHTFVVGVEGAPDLSYAQAVSNHVGTQHHEKVCTPEEMLSVLPEVIYHLESFDALLVRSSIMNFLVGRLASEYVPAVLSGEGGDELFAGYAYLKDLPPAELNDELTDITGRLHNTALQRVDRCSASHGLVARTGFLDQGVVDYAMRIPPEMKISDHGAPVEKWILRQAIDGLLPENVVARTKSKFWEGAGVGDFISDHAEEVISDSEFRSERAIPADSSLNTKEELLYYRIFKDYFGTEVDLSLVGRTKGAPVA